MQSILDLFILLFLTQLQLSHSVSANSKHGLRGNDTDHEALLAIKSEIYDPHSMLSSWNHSLPFCHWQGVVCGRRHRRVVSLRLLSRNLEGTLSPFIGNLSFLRELTLYNNSFRGKIPHQISGLGRLRKLVLQSNYFEGEIPANLSHCKHLNILSLNTNNLVGKIPPHLGNLPSLRVLDVLQNNLSGSLQDIGIGNFSTSLQQLVLSFNHLEGRIPRDIGRLEGLIALGLSWNMISGTIPTSLFNLSKLDTLDLSGNKFHGNLPQHIGFLLPQLSHLYISNCSLSGQFPMSISNLSKLVTLDISFNSFLGKFYINGNNQPYLSNLYVQYAFPSGDLSFLDTLTNCTGFIDLFLEGNSFIGNFPPSILNFSSSLRYINLGDNQIFGKVPLGLGKFVNLLGLWLNNNNLTGSIPFDFCKMRSIQGLSLANNFLSGEIPSSLGNLIMLTSLHIHNNHFQGSLPQSLGNCKNLQEIHVSSNNFSGSFPTVLFRASSLISLTLGQNNFEGPLPVEISSLKNLDEFYVSQNRFSGEIPSTLGECMSLTYLNMSGNSFDGSIPRSFSSLKNIKQLDLSSNHFSGQIPYYFSTWPSLLILNLSFNDLNGNVPTHGIFANTSVMSIVGNDKLCGGVPQLHLPRCPEQKHKRSSSRTIMIISVSCVLIVALSVSMCLYFLFSSRKRKDPPSGPPSTRSFLDVSYQMLHIATKGFSKSNLIGVGGFGSVYKGTLQQDDTELVVAVKVMNLGNEGAAKSFMAECKALRNIRHRNLTKVITACSSIDAQRNDFKALVYEFMPRGSLEDWLHPPISVTNTSENGGGSLSLLQRLSTVIDVASALEYLHIGCLNPIIHCDLKPSNILIDDEMTAHVGDFGLTKFVSGASTNTTNHSRSTQVRGTVGYAAPEYGIGSKVSSKGDMYSLGIVILEMMTSKKPTDPMFNNGLNLHEHAKATLPDRVMEIIDQKMLGDVNELRAINGSDIRKMECIKSLIIIGVQCSMELPQERMNIKDVVNKLKPAMQNLLGRA